MRHHGGGLLGRAHAETHRDRQIGGGAQTGDVARQIRGRSGAGAGDAGDGDVIDKARRAFEHLLQPCIGGGGGDQPDDVQRICLGIVQDQVGLLRRQIDDDQPVHPGLRGIDAELRHAVREDGVEIAHQHQRGAGIAGAELAHQVQYAPQRRPGLQPAQPGGLNGRAIGHRVGEGHADLDDVRAIGGHAQEQRQGGRAVRVEGLNEGDQGAAALLAQTSEYTGDAAHRLVPRCLATVKISLSPRPERLSRMICSLPISGAILEIWAKA